MLTSISPVINCKYRIHMFYNVCGYSRNLATDYSVLYKSLISNPEEGNVVWFVWSFGLCVILSIRL